MLTPKVRTEASPMQVDTDIRSIGSQLLAAYGSGVPIPPLSVAHPNFDVDCAYRIQQYQVQSWLDAGERIVGRKVGLTSKVMQRQMAVKQPDFGVITDRMIIDGQESIPADRFIQPRVEPEIAFVLKQSLTGPGATVIQAISAVDHVVAALEIIDSRIEGWRIGIVDTIADNASSGAVVLGNRPRLLSELDLPLVGCVMHQNGMLATTGAGGAILGSPVNSLVWLANTLGVRGEELPAGAVVLLGSMTASVAVGNDDTSIAIDVTGLGTVVANFSVKPGAETCA
jgi:2-keto-4-pentenoate hydratase